MFTEDIEHLRLWDLSKVMSIAGGFNLGACVLRILILSPFIPTSVIHTNIFSILLWQAPGYPGLKTKDLSNF